MLFLEIQPLLNFYTSIFNLKMKANKFLLIGFILQIIAFSSYVMMFYFQLEAPIKAEWWINNSYYYKDFRAKNIKSKKIIIISGSNSLFGINSKLIETKTGYPVSNLAVHASLDISFLYYKIKQHIQEGDTVVLPLEFPYYYRTDNFSNWFSNNMMAWGIDYLKKLPLIDLARFIVITEPSRILEGLIKKVEANGINKKLLNQKKVIKQLNELWFNGGVKWRGYSHESLNQFGDINADEAVTYNKDTNYFDKKTIISSHFVKNYKKIEELVNKYHGTLYLTYPVTIRNKLFDLSKKKNQKNLTNLENLLKNQNIKIQCNAALFHLDRIYYFNTRSHPNKYGALIRSENLANCINRLIKEPDSEKLTYKQAISSTNLLQQQYFNKVKKATVTNFDKRYKALTLIKEALEKYFKTHGSYPVSSGFDGLYTKWGKSGKNWIKDLSPKYIKNLPRDPRNTNNANEQYIYKSNGKDYKLLAHKPEDCKIVKSKHKKLIDPKRDCWAYGYWTKGAVNW